MAKIFSKHWQQELQATLAGGQPVSPREKKTLELLHRTHDVAMSHPVLTVPERLLSYPFMAAEANWILSGDDTVAGIAPWNSRISEFSDDGITFYGAYGPRIQTQLPYVIDKLVADPDTRQAGLTIWRECPPATKDVPCTVAVFFSLRQATLDLHVFMRSSDLWLGLPYDVFNMSMLGHYVCGLLNERLGAKQPIRPGTLHLTTASSHLYEVNWAAARGCTIAQCLHQNPVPEKLFTSPQALLAHLHLLRDTKPGDPLRWWEVQL